MQKDKPEDGFLAEIPAALTILSAFLVPLLITARTEELGAMKILLYECLVVSAVFAWLVHALGQGVLRLPSGGVVIALLAFWGVSFLSYVRSPFRLESGAELWRISVLLFLALLAAAHMTTPARRRRLLYAIAISALLVGAYGAMQWLGLDPVRWRTDRGREVVSSARVFSFLGNPNMLAGFGVGVLPIFLATALGTKDGLLRGLSLLAGAGMFISFLGTQSRGGFLGLAMSLLVILAVKRSWVKSFVRQRTSLAVLFCALLLGGGALLAREFLPRLFARTAGLFQKEGKPELRLVIWKAALRGVAERPILGSGIGTFKIRFPEHRDRDYLSLGLPERTIHAHSEVLEILFDMGMTGLAAFLALLGVFFAHGFRALGAGTGEDRAVALGANAALVGLLTHNLVSVNMRWPTCGFFFFLLLGLLPALAEEPLPVRLSLPAFLRRGGLRLGLGAILALSLGALVYSHTIRPFRSELLLRRGSLWNELGAPERAAPLLQEAVRLHPNNKRALYEWGRSLAEMRRFIEAEKVYRSLKDLSPHFPRVHYDLAVALAGQERWKEAIAEYRVEEGMGGVPTGSDFGALLLRLDRTPEGRERHIRALARLLDEDTQNVEAETCLGRLYFEKGLFPEALDHARKALALDETSVPALNILAGIHFARGEHDRAVSVSLRMIELAPRYATARVNLGRIYYHRGEKDRARKTWLDAARIDPDDREITGLLDLVP
ncbi:MAG: O-antigen ligase family protein [Planctomycetota bacterium]